MFYKNDKASSVPGFFMSGGGAASLLALVCAVLPAQSVAQNFPNKPMKLIVTSSPGGPTDVLARPIAEKMGEILGRAAALELVAVCGYMTLLTNVLKVTKCSLSDGSVDVV